MPIQIIDNFFVSIDPTNKNLEQPQQTSKLLLKSYIIIPLFTDSGRAKGKSSDLAQNGTFLQKEKESPKPKNLAQSFKSMLQNTMKNFRTRHEDLPIKEGALKKRSPSFLHAWQLRYIVLRDKKLFYYREVTKEKPAGCLDFDLFSAKLEVSEKDPRIFVYIFDRIISLLLS